MPALGRSKGGRRGRGPCFKLLQCPRQPIAALQLPLLYFREVHCSNINAINAWWKEICFSFFHSCILRWKVKVALKILSGHTNYSEMLSSFFRQGLFANTQTSWKKFNSMIPPTLKSRPFVFSLPSKKTECIKKLLWQEAN